MQVGRIERGHVSRRVLEHRIHSQIMLAGSIREEVGIAVSPPTESHAVRQGIVAVVIIASRRIADVVRIPVGGLVSLFGILKQLVVVICRVPVPQNVTPVGCQRPRGRWRCRRVAGKDTSARSR